MTDRRVKAPRCLNWIDVGVPDKLIFIVPELPQSLEV